MFNVKIKTTIVTLFVAVVTIVISVMIYFQYKSNSDFALLTTKTLQNNIADKSITQIEAYNKSSVDFINIVENINNIDQDIEFSKQHILLPIITNYINSRKYIYGVYLGFSDETFYIVYNVNLSDKMKSFLNAPVNSKWLVQKNKKINDKIISIKTFLDANLNTILTQKEMTQYQPTQRPWYKNAIKSKELIKTEPYIFDALNKPGITYAKKINDKKGIVLSIDITLNSLNNLLSNQTMVEGSSIFLYNKNGTILGYHNKTNNKKLKNINDDFPNIFIQNEKILDINKQSYITINNVKYVKDTKKINISNSSEDYLTILSPLDTIMEPYRKKILDVLVTTILIVLFLVIPLMYIFVRLLVKPILLLTNESKKINKDIYDNVKHVDSFMIELSQLSDSLVDMSHTIKEKTQNNEKLIEIGYNISSEHNYDLLLESILLGAKELSGADGGTLYIFNEDESTLEFKTVMNSSLNIYLGGSKSQIKWPALQMYEKNAEINKKNISVVSALENRLICIDDVYTSDEFHFAGAKNFDKNNNYKTTSMLVIPVNNRDGELVGVIQLINKIKNDEVTYFNNMDKTLIQSMGSLSAMALHNSKLVGDLEKLLYSLIESIGSALGEKSTYTAKHVDNVAELSLLIAKAVNEDETSFKNINFSKEELEEIKLASWLHDIGKVTTPEYIVDKSTRLETIFDRLHLIEAKIEIAKRDLQIEHLENKIDKNLMEKNIELLETDLIFVETLNKGGEFMSHANQERLDEILSRKEISIKNKSQKLLNDDEYHNLSIEKGTLTNEERDIINNHVLVSYNMLKKVHFPKRFSQVPILAGSHHKTIDGGGYAHEDIKHLKMTMGDKILAVADIFEALSSHDRPYRGPNKLSQIAKILMFMVKDGHLDQDLVRFVLENKVYENYIEANFLEEQKDEIDLDFDDIKYLKEKNET